MPRYILFNKPYLVLTTRTDPEGRPTLANYIPISDVFAVGRLDYRSEGLLLLTDDGDLAHRLTDPKFEHPKTYLVQVEGAITPEAIDRLRRGVAVKGEKTRPAGVDPIPPPDLPPRNPPVVDYQPTSWLKIVLREGKKRQIRHITAAVGYPTLRLVRIAIGSLTSEGLSPGDWRDLTMPEVEMMNGKINR